VRKDGRTREGERKTKEKERGRQEKERKLDRGRNR
jgi:hypothetical protein